MRKLDGGDVVTSTVVTAQTAAEDFRGAALRKVAVHMARTQGDGREIWGDLVLVMVPSATGVATEDAIRKALGLDA